MLGERSALGPEALVVLSIGAVLEGSIFGDHCSPISDTTVLSSVATASDHLAHVKTQAPYAMLVMVVTLALGYLPVAYLGASPWICLVICVLALAGILLTLGSDPADPTPEEARARTGAPLRPHQP
jgi:Na+/H+ antiporter NhaC